MYYIVTAREQAKNKITDTAAQRQRRYKMKYMLIDHKETGDTLYTLEQLKKYFGAEEPETIEGLRDWLEEEAYGMKVPYEIIPMPWYAIMTDSEDTDHGTGTFVYSEAMAELSRYRENGYKDAYIAVVDDDDDFVIDEIR